MNKQIWGVQDNADRQANMVSGMEIAEIIQIYPHTDIYPADKHFMFVDLKIRDLKQPPQSDEEICEYLKLNVVQHGVGKLWGKAWMPRKGDVVLIQRIKNSDAIFVMGQIFNFAQEPVVTSYDDEKNVSMVDKWIQHEQPVCNNTLLRNFEEGDYLEPAARDHPTCQPVCHKIFSKNRDQMQVFGCDHGYIGNDPHCKECVRTGYIQTPEVIVFRTNSKETCNQDGSARVEELPYYEKCRRFQILHHNGSVMTWDDDGNIRLQNDVDKVEKGHVHMDPYGSIEVRSTPEASSTGSYVKVYGPDDPFADDHGAVAAQMFNVDTKSRVTIYKNGDIIIWAAGEIDVLAKGNINIVSEKDISVKGKNISITAEELLTLAGKVVNVSATDNLDLSGNTMGVSCTGSCSLSGSSVGLSSTGSMNLTSAIEVNVTAPVINLNGVVHGSLK